MSFTTALLKAYETAEDLNIVDKYDEFTTVLLPLFHSSMKSNNKNIICIYMNSEGEFEKAEYLPDKQVIIFPVTEQSVSRSGSNPPPHPLSDKLQYIIPVYLDKHQNYLRELNQFYGSAETNDGKKFLRSTLQLLQDGELLNKIVKDLYPIQDVTINEMTVSYPDEKNKKISVDLSSVFVTFAVTDFNNHQTATVSNLKSLHEEYIQYFNQKIEPNGICNISGESDYITQKHRGLLGNAKLISVSNNKETYAGRFKEKTDIVRIGYRSSEKIHLMLKYLLENPNSHAWLGEQQYLVNWFSDDISNDRQVNLTKNSNEFFAFLNSQNNAPRRNNPVTQHNKQVNQAFKRGDQSIKETENYYIAIIDKASNGRISLKYFRELSVSKLLENLQKWQQENAWWRYKKELNKSVLETPSLYQLIDTTMGVERDGNIVLSNDNYRKMQIRDLVTCIVEGKTLPNQYFLKADLNCRNRLSYPDAWNQMLFTALAVLNNKKEAFNEMIDRDNNNRSYLFGRLLAVYERMEAASFDKESKRTTNAEKFWTSYTNNPATMMNTLENKVKSYEHKLQHTHPGIYNTLQREKNDIINKLHDNSFNNINSKLNYEFIFGYYAEIKDIFTKKTDVGEKNDDQ